MPISTLLARLAELARQQLVVGGHTYECPQQMDVPRCSVTCKRLMKLLADVDVALARTPEED